MAGGSNKSSAKNKQTDKNNELTSHAEEGGSQLQATGQNSQEATVSQKLDILLNVVKDMGAQLEDHGERLCKQEEKVSIQNISALPSGHSSPKAANSVNEPLPSKPDRMPSFEALKTDSRIQAEVARRLHEYQNASRVDGSGKPLATLKSGRYRAGVAKIKTQVNWPQDFCSVPVGSKQSTYDELSNDQWVQGFLLCMLEEKDQKLRESMLQYYSWLMQDAIELNIMTARRAHAAVLQEIEKGKISWDRLDLIEKVKCRYTQRIVECQKQTGGMSNQACRHFNKVFCRIDNDHVVNGILYMHCCTFCLKGTGRKYNHPASKCL